MGRGTHENHGNNNKRTQKAANVGPLWHVFLATESPNSCILGLLWCIRRWNACVGAREWLLPCHSHCQLPKVLPPRANSNESHFLGGHPVMLLFGLLRQPMDTTTTYRSACFDCCSLQWQRYVCCVPWELREECVLVAGVQHGDWGEKRHVSRARE